LGSGLKQFFFLGIHLCLGCGSGSSSIRHFSRTARFDRAQNPVQYGDYPANLFSNLPAKPAAVS
jgi:hypothetical protein